MRGVNNYTVDELTQLAARFCKSQNKQFGCKEVFGCLEDDTLRCGQCPLAGFLMALELVTQKNLSMGDAFRLCLTASPAAVERREILRQLLQEKKYYPKRKE